jgi:hypothetical protein
MADQNFTTEELESEEWRSIAAFPAYLISNLGRVKRGHKVLKVQMGSEYPRINFSTGKRHQSKKRTIHSFVALAFLGSRPKGKVINHKDGDKQNNRAINLEYVTHSENFRHAVVMGMMRRASGYYPIIKRLRDSGISDNVIQWAFQLSPRRMAIMKRRCR